MTVIYVPDFLRPLDDGYAVCFYGEQWVTGVPVNSSVWFVPGTIGI